MKSMDIDGYIYTERYREDGHAVCTDLLGRKSKGQEEKKTHVFGIQRYDDIPSILDNSPRIHYLEV